MGSGVFLFSSNFIPPIISLTIFASLLIWLRYTSLNELLLFIGVLGGLEAFGLLGLVAGPTIVAAAMGVFRVYMERRDELAAKGA